MGKGKSTKKQKLMSPFMLVLAAMTAWAATHEPAHLNMGSTGVWLLEALAVALLVRAGLALLAPLLGMAGALAGRLWQDARGTHAHGGHHGGEA